MSYLPCPLDFWKDLFGSLVQYLVRHGANLKINIMALHGQASERNALQGGLPNVKIRHFSFGARRQYVGENASDVERHSVLTVIQVTLAEADSNYLQSCTAVVLQVVC